MIPTTVVVEVLMNTGEPVAGQVIVVVMMSVAVSMSPDETLLSIRTSVLVAEYRW